MFVGGVPNGLDKNVDNVGSRLDEFNSIIESLTGVVNEDIKTL
jgi:hypothetical protein